MAMAIFVIFWYDMAYFRHVILDLVKLSKLAWFSHLLKEIS